jgi:hypothetical protein
MTAIASHVPSGRSRYSPRPLNDTFPHFSSWCLRGRCGPQAGAMRVYVLIYTLNTVDTRGIDEIQPKISGCAGFHFGKQFRSKRKVSSKIFHSRQ